MFDQVHRSSGQSDIVSGPGQTYCVVVLYHCYSGTSAGWKDPEETNHVTHVAVTRDRNGGETFL